MSKQQTIEQIKGKDANNNPFTAFILCDEKDKEDIIQCQKGNKKINLNDLNILHTIAGHKVDQQLLKDLVEFATMYFAPHDDDSTEAVLGESSPAVDCY